MRSYVEVHFAGPKVNPETGAPFRWSWLVDARDAERDANEARVRWPGVVVDVRARRGST